MQKTLSDLWYVGARLERAKWIDAEAGALIRALGEDAYAAARKRVRESNDLSAMRYWGAVKDAVGRETTGAYARLCETVPPIESLGPPIQADESTEFEFEYLHNPTDRPASYLTLS